MEQGKEQFSAEFEKFLEKYLERRMELKRVHITVFNTITALVIGGLGLIAALAWDQFLRMLFATILHQDNELITSLTYAVIVTVIAVIAAVMLGKSGESKHK